MVGLLFDTNILIDFLLGRPEAANEFSRAEDRAISAITFMEVLVGADARTEEAVRAFLGRFTWLPVDGPVSERAVLLRRQHRIKLPDAIIWASAQVHGRVLITRNTKDFPKSDPGVRVPYQV